jgi:hypothetical protein
MKRIVTLVILLCATWLVSACHNGTSSGEGGDRSAVIVGTVVDAATGKSVANAKVEGPGGRKTTSDDAGRFRLEGFEIGTTGEVKASVSDGRSASVVLQRLSEKKLEIVLHLKRP